MFVWFAGLSKARCSARSRLSRDAPSASLDSALARPIPLETRWKPTSQLHLRRDRAPLMGAYGEWTRDSDIVRRLWGHGEASSSSAPSRGGPHSMAVKEYKAMNVEPLRHSPEQRTSRCPG